MTNSRTTSSSHLLTLISGIKIVLKALRSTYIPCLWVALCSFELQVYSIPPEKNLDPTKFGLQPDSDRTRFNSSRSESRASDWLIENHKPLIVTQLEGSQFRRTDSGLLQCKLDDTIRAETSLFVRSNSLMEMQSQSGVIVRLGSNTNLDIELERTFKLYKGAMLVSLPDDRASYTLQSPLSTVQISGKGAVMFGVTEIGGIKAICVNGRTQLTLKDKVTADLKPGELIFVFTEGKNFSRKVHLELATVMQTSSLISDFKEPLPFLEELANNARKQNRRIKGRFKALVGDAKSDQDFELMILRDKSQSEEQKAPD